MAGQPQRQWDRQTAATRYSTRRSYQSYSFSMDVSVWKTLAPLAGDTVTDRIAVAALRQFELFGMYRSTMEDIAKRAGVSRVTLYRRFPGKQQLAQAVVLNELEVFLAALDATLGDLPTADDKLAEGFVFTVDALRTHVLLNRLMESEPESLMPFLTGELVVTTARDYLAQRLAKDYDDNRGGEELLVAAELVARLVLSFLLTPATLVPLDDPAAARRFAVRYLGPMLGGAATSGGGA